MPPSEIYSFFSLGNHLLYVGENGTLIQYTPFGGENGAHRQHAETVTYAPRSPEAEWQAEVYASAMQCMRACKCATIAVLARVLREVLAAYVAVLMI